MSIRKVKFKPNSQIQPCPKCGNKTEFTIHGEQVAEDGCEVWAVCKCGYDPTEFAFGFRLEDVWGGCGDDNCYSALRVWNEACIATA